jgi:lysophospholipase L1-like esterase
VTPHRRGRLSFRITAASLGLALAAIAGETLFRLVERRVGRIGLYAEAQIARSSSIWTYSADPELVYEHRANYVREGIRLTESHGILRDRDVSERADPDVFRVAVVGDSIAAALYLARGDGFGERLEGLLNGSSTAARYEVLNFSVNGYGAGQEARVVESRVSRFAPRLVVIAYCMNDPGTSLTPRVWFENVRRPMGSHALEWTLNLLHIRRIAPELPDLVPMQGPDRERSDYWPRLYRRDGAAWQRVEAAFDREAASAKAIAAPVLVVVFPLLIEGWDRVPMVREMHAQVGGAAERRGWTTIDLLDAYKRRRIGELRQSERDIYHPTALGHQIAADAVAARIATR